MCGGELAAFPREVNKQVVALKSETRECALTALETFCSRGLRSIVPGSDFPE